MGQILLHPDNVAALKEAFLRRNFAPLSAKCEPTFHGLPVIADPFTPKTLAVETGRILFPDDRFVEYGPEDEGWALALGFAKKETIEEMVVYAVEMPEMFECLHPLAPALEFAELAERIRQQAIASMGAPKSILCQGWV